MHTLLRPSYTAPHPFIKTNHHQRFFGYPNIKPHHHRSHTLSRREQTPRRLSPSISPPLVPLSVSIFVICYLISKSGDPSRSSRIGQETLETRFSTARKTTYTATYSHKKVSFFGTALSFSPFSTSPYNFHTRTNTGSVPSLIIRSPRFPPSLFRPTFQNALITESPRPRTRRQQAHTQVSLISKSPPSTPTTITPTTLSRPRTNVRTLPHTTTALRTPFTSCTNTTPSRLTPPRPYLSVRSTRSASPLPLDPFLTHNALLRAYYTHVYPPR